MYLHNGETCSNQKRLRHGKHVYIYCGLNKYACKSQTVSDLYGDSSSYGFLSSLMLTIASFSLLIIVPYSDQILITWGFQQVSALFYFRWKAGRVATGCV